MAAVLASGPGAVLSHQSAASLWQFRDTARGRIDLTAPRKLHPRPGLHPHCAVLPPDEVTTAHDIPVTTPPRTLLDLAAVLSRHALARAVNEAEVLRLTDPLSLADLLTRHPRRRGVAALRQILDEGRVGATITRSELENRFLAFLAGNDVPRPEVNVRIDDLEADCVWHDARLVAELDGYASHGTRSAFERDRARDRRLQAAGWRVIRVTWWHLLEEPATLVRELRALLGLEPA